MNDFTKEEIIKRYDSNSVKYILTKNIRSFEQYCTCGAYANDVIRHTSYCPQELEVQRFLNE